MIEHLTKITVRYDSPDADTHQGWVAAHCEEIEDAISKVVGQHQLEDHNYFGGNPACGPYFEAFINHDPTLATQLEREIVDAVESQGWVVEPQILTT